MAPRRTAMPLVNRRPGHARRPRLPGQGSDGRAFAQAVVRPLGGAGPAAAELAKAAAELAPKDAVDDEVDGRVGRHDDVADVGVKVVGPTARVLDADDVQKLVEKRRSLADHEDDDYDDHHLKAKAYNTSRVAPQAAHHSYSGAVHVTQSGGTAYRP